MVMRKRSAETSERLLREIYYVYYAQYVSTKRRKLDRRGESKKSQFFVGRLCRTEDLVPPVNIIKILQIN